MPHYQKFFRINGDDKRKIARELDIDPNNATKKQRRDVDLEFNRRDRERAKQAAERNREISGNYFRPGRFII